MGREKGEGKRGKKKRKREEKKKKKITKKKWKRKKTRIWKMKESKRTSGLQFLSVTQDYKPTIFYFWHTLLNWHHSVTLFMLNMPRMCMYMYTNKKHFLSYKNCFFN
uniref:Uncharacterized protein n=1 Tax=Strongyloides stercoralis TaxID=6248 RepID=A0AAF5I3U4_STRER